MRQENDLFLLINRLIETIVDQRLSTIHLAKNLDQRGFEHHISAMAHTIVDIMPTERQVYFMQCIVDSRFAPIHPDDIKIIDIEESDVIIKQMKYYIIDSIMKHGSHLSNYGEKITEILIDVILRLTLEDIIRDIMRTYSSAKYYD